MLTFNYQEPQQTYSVPVCIICLLFFKKRKFNVCRCFAQMRLYTTRVPSVYKGQKRVLDHLVLELQIGATVWVLEIEPAPL